MTQLLPFRIKPVLLFLVLLLCYKGNAQCNNWSASAQLVTASSCASNGTFNVTLSGPDVANLSNIQYGIPITNGYSVALNNSPNFSSIPPGTYQVSVVANCGGTQVGKNTSINIPGNYVSPYLAAPYYVKGSLACLNSGAFNVFATDGLAPFHFNFTSTPAAYSGPTSFSSNTNSYSFNNLPPGTYQVQAVDACGSGSNIQTVVVNSLIPADAPMEIANSYFQTCDTVVVAMPYINPPSSGSPWNGWAGDPSFKASVQISGNIFNPIPLQGLNIYSVTVPLTPGHTLKDCYGKILTYTIHPPCGPDWQIQEMFPYPSIQNYVSQTCSTMDVDLYFNNMCLPITYSYQAAGGATYGPFTTNVSTVTLQGIPTGSYSLMATSGDGVQVNSSFSGSPTPPSPYSVSVINGAVGYNNYIYGFKFTAMVNTQGRYVELFSGPAGYSFHKEWLSFPSYIVHTNETPILPGTKLFPPGNYVWKITDSCGVYYLPITVGPQDVFQFNPGIDHQKQTCQGMWVWPKGTATSNGSGVPIHFSVLYNGIRMLNANGVWPSYSVGDSFLISAPGQYTIVAYKDYPTSDFSFYVPNPNAYTVPYTFTYSLNPITMDMNATQGFVCKGTQIQGQGKIYAQGAGGTPFSGTAPYQYALALQGNGATGPYIASNNTGVFTNFGGNANAVYDVKVTDACGAFAVQPVKILDLAVARLAAASKYVSCVNGTVQLSAIYLPGATYSWTGPNGFTSNQRQPVITNATAANTGVYYVTISTPTCSQSVTDSTTLVLNANPSKPSFTVNCGPPVVLSIANAQSYLKYAWQKTNINPPYYTSQWQSDSANSLHPYVIGYYKAVATDTTTGCMSYSNDSLLYNYDDDELTIYSPHLQLCPGDTTILVASSTVPTYQWYKNGVVIPGATSQTYITAIPGVYKVMIQPSQCQTMSAEVTVTNIPAPSANITGPHDICAGTTALLQTPAGTGYAYTWTKDGVSITGNNVNALTASQTGSYMVTVTNQGCAAVSAPYQVTVYNKPTIALTPSTPQTICNGSSVNFMTPACNACSFTWQQNGTNIPGATANTYTATIAGTYRVKVGNGNVCPDTTSAAIQVTVLPAPTAAISGATHDICANSSVVLQTNTDPIYTYSWKQNGNAISGATQASFSANLSGSYTVTVSNGACTTTSAPFLLNVHPLPFAMLSPSTPQHICPGESVTFSTPYDPAFSYAWQRNGSNVPGSGNTYTTGNEGSYTVTVNSAFCPSAISSPVTIDILPTAVHLPNDTVICEPAFSITLSAGAGFTSYVWSTGETSEKIMVTTPGVYYVTATDKCGDFTDTMVIHALSEYLPNLPADTIVCNQNNAATLAVGALYNSIHWSTGATTSFITVTQAGTYWVKVETPCGTIYDTTDVAFCAPVVDYMNLPQQVICEGDCIAPTAQVSHYPLSYQWYFAGGNPSGAHTAVPGIICYANAGVYPIKLVVSNLGGSDSMTMQVTVNSKPVAEFKDSALTVSYKTNLSLPACTIAQRADWYKDGVLICSDCPVLKIEAKYFNTTYHCVVSNGDCHDSCTYSIRVIDIPHDVWLPDAFTPNGDGRNDVFHIITDNPNVLVTSLSVFNRWGQRVFVSNMNNDGWDGTFNGKACELGTYYWMIQYKILGTDEVYSQKGDVTLVR